MIDITDVDKIKMIKKVYELSSFKNQTDMFINFDSLSDEEAKTLIKEDGTIYIDSLYGKNCKFATYKYKNKIVITDKWYDHTQQDLINLLNHLGIKIQLNKINIS